MSYNGHEIFYQNLGSADSIYIRDWSDGIPTNILIDGGRKGHIDQIEKFLTERAGDCPEANSTIHHLVCSHSDDDHVGGLVPLVENQNFQIDQAWVHDLRETEFLPNSLDKILLEAWGATALLEKIEQSEQTRISLLEALESRQIPHASPYQGTAIGPLLVLGPTVDFFKEQYDQLKQEDSAKSLNTILVNRAYEQTLTLEAIQKSEDSKELGEGTTTPINEVSTVIALATEKDDKALFYLFTGDVGPKGLDQVIEATGDSLKNLRWLDVPHHGSRRSMRQDQIDHFAPTSSFISAKGSVKHPSRKMVNALKKHGTVFSTHYSITGTWLNQTNGTTPVIPGTVSATPLYDKNK